MMKKQLWLRLRQYHFDDVVPSHLRDHVRAMFGGSDASTEAFASKLARKLGWTRVFSLRAIEEYRKFVYLGMVSDASVTPPKVIDQVWHEHLLFSRAYRQFCRDVLERDFDHNPELVPSEGQTEAFHAQYAATLELYRDEFNMMPPADIWGTPKFRTDEDQIQMPKPKATDRTSSENVMASSGGDIPLYMFFDGGGDGGNAGQSMPEFGGGDGFSGGGSGSSWGDGTESNHGGDAGDSGGGSSCSSSCGGGGGD